ncbi:hypothetical protein ACROYT_G020011 [Oculina patagonica]
MASCDKNRLSPAQQNSKIPVRKATCLSTVSGNSSSSKDKANKKQRIPDSVEKLPQNKRPSRIPIVALQKDSKTGDKRPLGKDSGINLQEIHRKQAADITGTNTSHAAKRSNPNPATKSTPLVRRRTPLNTPLTNQVSSCDEIHKKELEQLEKENTEIIEELQLWVEDGDQENKTLEEIIEKTNEENVKLLVQNSGMKNEIKYLQEKNDTLQAELETKRADVRSLRFQVDALEKEAAHFKTCELDYRKLKEQTSRAIDQLEVQLNKFIDESTRVISEKDNEINELKEEKTAVRNKLEDQLVALMKENAKIMFEKDKELNERLQEEKSKVFDQFKDRIASFMNENAKIISEKDKEMNELKKQKSKVIEQLEDEKWSIIGQFNERLAEKDKELTKLQHEISNNFDQFKDRLALIMDENARFMSNKDKEINKLKEDKSKSFCQLNNQLAKLKKENTTMKA